MFDIVPAGLNSSYSFLWLCQFPRCPFPWRRFSVSFDNSRQSHSLTLSSIWMTTKPLALVSPLIFNISIFQLLTVIFMRLFHTSNTMHHTRTHHYPIKPIHSFDICTSVNSIPISSERLQGECVPSEPEPNAHVFSTYTTVSLIVRISELMVFMSDTRCQTDQFIRACALSHAQLFVTPWAVAHQAPLSMEIFQARILE